MRLPWGFLAAEMAFFIAEAPAAFGNKETEIVSPVNNSSHLNAY